MGRVIWTEAAMTDVAEIRAFFAKDSPQYAARLVDRFRDAAGRLAQGPHTGWVVPEFEETEIREVLVNSYRVIYVVRGEDCHIVAVIHGHRDLARALKSDDLPKK